MAALTAGLKAAMMVSEKVVQMAARRAGKKGVS
jgi:hypothetical protein